MIVPDDRVEDVFGGHGPKHLSWDPTDPTAKIPFEVLKCGEGEHAKSYVAIQPMAVVFVVCNKWFESDTKYRKAMRTILNNNKTPEDVNMVGHPRTTCCGLQNAQKNIDAFFQRSPDRVPEHNQERKTAAMKAMDTLVNIIGGTPLPTGYRVSNTWKAGTCKEEIEGNLKSFDEMCRIWLNPSTGSEEIVPPLE